MVAFVCVCLYWMARTIGLLQEQIPQEQPGVKCPVQEHNADIQSAHPLTAHSTSDV